MPRRDDISSILLIGSGPIVIGQACEFDYSGTQACRVLRDEGYRVILANSNPATIMTDPEFADATYIEPLTLEVLTEIIKVEKPDALLPTLGGQTALNLAMEAVEAGVLDQYGVELIGADAEAIATAEDRERFKIAMIEIGLEVPLSASAEAPATPNRNSSKRVWPRPEKLSRRLDCQSSSARRTSLAARAPALPTPWKNSSSWPATASNRAPISEILIEESIKGWKEFELEVMRDHADNCVVVCAIENLDPMGVHTGDSITVAPAQTLTDVEYQKMRDDAFAVMRESASRPAARTCSSLLTPSMAARLSSK